MRFFWREKWNPREIRPILSPKSRNFQVLRDKVVGFVKFWPLLKKLNRKFQKCQKVKKSRKIVKIFVFFAQKILRNFHFFHKLKNSLFQLFAKIAKIDFFVRFLPGNSKIAIFWKNWKNRVLRCGISRFCTCEFHKKSRFYSISLNPDFPSFGRFFQFLSKMASSEFTPLMVRLKLTFQNWKKWTEKFKNFSFERADFLRFWVCANFANCQKTQKIAFLVFLKNEK